MTADSKELSGGSKDAERTKSNERIQTDLLSDAMAEILALGLPIVGLSGDGEMQFSGEVTAEQRKQAEGIIDEYRKGRRFRKSYDKMLEEFRDLPQSEKLVVIEKVVLFILSQNPKLADQIGFNTRGTL